MKRICILFLLTFIFSSSYSQYVHTIKADSVKLTNDSCNTELIIENSTRNVCGFLFNRGNGRTEFKRGLILVPGTTNKFEIGCDTLDLSGLSSPVTSVFGRTGAVTAQASDYSAFYPQLSSSYSNPSWITTLAHSKLIYTGTSAQYINGAGAYTTFPTIPNDAGLLHTTGNETKSGVLTLTSNPIHTSMTKGSVPYYGTGGQLRQANANLFWDSATNQLRINGTIAIMDGATEGMKWIYNSSTHFLSIAPIDSTTGPLGFWNNTYATAGNQGRTNILSMVSIPQGFMMGTLQSRSVNIQFDFARAKPSVSTYDLGDVVMNAGNISTSDAKPDVVLWKKIGTTGTTAYQWAEVKGEAEYQYQTTNATAANLIVDLGPSTGTFRYKMSISARNASTGDVWSEDRIYVFGNTGGSLSYKNLTTVSSYSEGTMSGCAVGYAISGGNTITWSVTGLAATTIDWRVSVTRTIY